MPEFSPAAWSSFGLFFLTTFVSIITIVDPLMVAPIFVGLTENYTHAERVHLAKRTAIVVFFILMTFLASGGLFLNLFGISIHAIRIAGGLMILGSAANMVERKDRMQQEDTDEAMRKAKVHEDLAFTPLAMPLLSGPGAIAVIIGSSTDANHPDGWVFYLIMALVILIVSFLCYVALALSEPIVRKLGKTAIKSLTRMMGFILLCVGVQFIVNGILPLLKEVLSQPYPAR